MANPWQIQYAEGRFRCFLQWEEREPIVNYFTVAPMFMSFKEWFIDEAIKAAKRASDKTFNEEVKIPYPFGTFIGVRGYVGAGFSTINALQPWALPPINQGAKFYGFRNGTTQAQINMFAPHGGYIFGGIKGFATILCEIYNDNGNMVLRTLDEYWGASWYSYFATRNGFSPHDMFLYIKIKETADEPYTPPFPIYTLYHRIKVAADIEPANGTRLAAGQIVNIRAIPNTGRQLTSFKVDTTEMLPGAVKTYADLSSLPATEQVRYPSGFGETNYGPVSADVYVDAIADAVEIEESIMVGVPQTIQMYTTDCFDGTWSLGDSDLPASVTKSIGSTGLITLFCPEDVYDGNPGGTFYLDVLFEGFSQTIWKRLILEILDVPAYGTSWAELTDLGAGAVNGLLEDTNGDLYVVTVSKVFKSTDGTVFSEVTMTGTRVGDFGDISITADGNLFVSDRTGLWKKAPEEASFTRLSAAFSSYWASALIRLGSDSLTNELIVLHTSGIGFDPLVTVFDTTTMAKVVDGVRLGLGGRTSINISRKPTRYDPDTWILNGAKLDSTTLGTYKHSTQTVTEVLLTNPMVGVYMPKAGKAWAVVQIPASSNSEILESTDGGATWTQVIASVALGNTGEKFLLGLKQNYALHFDGGVIKRTTDNWSTLSAIVALPSNIRCVLETEARTLYLGTLNGKVYRSTT